MEKIKLSEKQEKILIDHLNGDYSPFFASEEDQLLFNDVIDMAEALMFKLDAVKEIGGDLMAWFWSKYKEQKDE